MDLETEFRAELTVLDVPLVAGASGDLEARLAALVARGRAAHPTLAIADGTFVRHLARAAARLGEAVSVSAVEALAVEDLYLAHACATGVAGALEQFEERCGKRIRMTVAASTKSDDVRAEAEQRVRSLLLVGGPDAPAKIASYGGQGPLDRWAAVVVQRLVITIVRGEATEQSARDRAALETAVVAEQPESAYAKQRYRSEFDRALRDALATLTERDRALLRLHLISGVEVERIGAIYGVSRSTATRWLADAREAVSAEVQRLLRERLSLSGGDVASLARLVASDVDVSMSRLLRTP